MENEDLDLNGPYLAKHITKSSAELEKIKAEKGDYSQLSDKDETYLTKSNI